MGRHESVSIEVHPTAIVEKGAELAEGVSIGPFCVIGEHVKIGRNTKLLSHVAIEGHTTIGQDNTIRPFANLGGPPQAPYNGEPTELVIGDRNTIREHVTMHVATGGGDGVTIVGSDCLFMATAHVAHDCVVRDHVVLAQSATLGGHVVIDEYVILGGLAAVHQNSRVGKHAFVGGLAAVTKDVIPYGSVWGNHAHLEGLNLVGLKRRGFSREVIAELRSAYRLLFAEEGTFQERIDDTAESFAQSAPVMEIIDFIRADASRPLCLPEREV